MSGPCDATPAEQHLGDRLAALVDGELGHDTRERVLAHLATCCKCKAEADAQRRLKSVFAETAPPPPSEGLLARLQGLPGGGDPLGRRQDPFGGRGAVQGFGGGVFGGRPDAFGFLPSVGHPATAMAVVRGSGLRIHESERSASRGRRLAFAAAGAVSVAAFALGGALPLEVVDAPGARGEGPGIASVPVHTVPDSGDQGVPGTGALPFLAGAGAGGQAYGSGSLSGSGQGLLGVRSQERPSLLAVSTGQGGPPALGPLIPAAGPRPPLRALPTPMLSVDMVLSPLIRDAVVIPEAEARPYGLFTAGSLPAAAPIRSALPSAPVEFTRRAVPERGFTAAPDSTAITGR